MIVINKLTKYAHFILFKETYDIEQLKHLYIDKIIRYQKILQKIINDKDKLFTSKY